MLQFERWSLPVIGEALLRGTTRREDFQTFLGIAPEILDSRLVTLVAAGILARETGPDGSVHFRPTAKGRGLEAALRALDAWSQEWDPLSTGALLDIADAVADAEVPSSAESPRVELSVLGAFDLRLDGESVDISPGSQRLLVFLALRDRVIARSALAGTMWPDVTEGRAGDSLRSAIARLEVPARSCLRSSPTGLRLSSAVAIDLRDAQSLAHRLLNSDSVRDTDVSSASITVLDRALLPDWYDDWVLSESEDWRHLRLNALEALARRLLESRLLGEAAAAARAAARIDPLREGPQAALIRVQLAMGDQSAALDVLDRYAAILHAAVGLAPTRQLAELVGAIER